MDEGSPSTTEALTELDRALIGDGDLPPGWVLDFAPNQLSERFGDGCPGLRPLTGELENSAIGGRGPDGGFHFNVEFVVSSPGAGTSMLAEMRPFDLEGCEDEYDELGIDALPLSPPHMEGVDEALGSFLALQRDGDAVIMRLGRYLVGDVLVLITILGTPGRVEAPLREIASYVVPRAVAWNAGQRSSDSLE